jgi:PleD family two-component response regulator
MTDLGPTSSDLPRVRPPAALAARWDARPPDAPVVLAVDDVPANLTVLYELLSPQHRVRVATSGARALRLA